MAEAFGGLARRLGAWLLELSAPSECVSCGEPETSLFCARCGEPGPVPAELLCPGVPLLTGGFHASPLKEAVHRFKYGDRPEFGAGLGRWLASRLSGLEVGPADVFAPVPLHRSRLAERGYDQSALLAQALARANRARFMPRLLERTRQTSQQATLDRLERANNVRAAFRVRQACGSGGVVLVDDVVTTGSTLLACAGALAGAEIPVIAAVAVARAASATKPENSGIISAE